MSSHHHHHYKRDFDDNSNNSNDSREERRKKRRSRWGGDEQDKIVIPGLPTVIPGKLTKEQEEMYLLQLQIETISRRLRTGELGIPEDPEARSPSPEPIYNSDGKRLNTREFRVRKKLEDERHQLIAQMITLNPSYKAPIDYKPPQTKLSDKVLIPQEEYPDINFVGLLIGPRGNTLKSMEKDTGAKIIIRGKGSIKEGKIGRKDGQPLPGEDEPLHAFLTGSTEESIAAATRQINKIIKQAIELPENQNNLRRTQLRELALLNGTLRENDVLSKRFCSNCGSVEHRNWQCPEKTNLVNTMHCSRCNGKGHLEKDCKYVPENESEIQVSQSKIDEEYFSFMAELGGASPSLISNANNNTTPNSVSNNTSSTTAADGGPLALTYTENNKSSANNETNNASETNGTALLPTPTDSATDKKKVITWIQKQGVWKQVVQDAADETTPTASENEKQEITATTADSLTTTTTTSASNFATAADPYIAYYNAYLDQALAEGQDLQTAQQTAIVNYSAWYQYYVAPQMAAMSQVAAATTATASEVGKYTAVPPPHQLTNQPSSGSMVSTASNIPTSSYGYGYQQPPPPPQ